MKIAWLVPGFPGTGGGRMNAVICGELLSQGADLSVFSYGGTMPSHWTQYMHLNKDLYNKIYYIDDLPAKWDGVLVCSDFGLYHKLLKAYDETEAKLKIWYFILTAHDTAQRLAKDDSLILASTPYLYKVAKEIGCSNVELLVGPADTANFYPLGAQYVRNNLCLVYPKKSGWVGVEALRYAQIRNPEIIAGPLGLGEEKWNRITYLEVGLPGHDVYGLRSLYAKSRMFVAADGGSQWGMNCCLMESALSCLPIVSTDWEGFSHIVEDGVTALTARWNKAPLEPGMDWMIRPDPMELGEKILDMFENPELASKLSKAANDRAMSYNLKAWCQRFMQIIDR